MLIGLVGHPSSGKRTVAEMLQKMGFYYISFSDILTEELTKKGMPITEENLTKIKEELISRQGADYLAKKAVEQLKDGENYVLTAMTLPEELNLLEKREDFLLVKITKSIKDNQNDYSIISQAKVVLLNNSTKEKLSEKVEKLVKDWLFKLQDSRPDWDHYFMNIAEQVKMRCNCLSAKKGAIIVKDKMILSTGYNGTPKGIKHCTEGGCPRCTSRHLGKIKSGVYSEPCICVHSEENAIIQAAYNGTSTKGSIMYTTFTPCTNCAKMIINAGIVEVIAKVAYPDDIGTQLLKEAGVKLRVLR